MRELGVLDGGMVHVARRAYRLNCNWKVFADNYLDGGYHVSTAHPGLAGQVRGREGRDGREFFWGGRETGWGLHIFGGVWVDLSLLCLSLFLTYPQTHKHTTTPH